MHKINSIFISVLCIGLISCGAKNTKEHEVVQLPQVQNNQSVAPGAPGVTPYWAYSGKTGIGTSYEAYLDGEYSDQAVTGKVSKVWFSLAQGIITETMYGLIHQAQIKDLQFVIKGEGLKEVTSFLIVLVLTISPGDKTRFFEFVPNPPSNTA